MYANKALVHVDYIIYISIDMKLDERFMKDITTERAPTSVDETDLFISAPHFTNIFTICSFPAVHARIIIVLPTESS